MPKPSRGGLRLTEPGRGGEMKNPQAGEIRSFDKGGTDSRHSTDSEAPQQYRVTCLEFRVFDKNTLKGFVTLRLEPPGMEIQGCSVHSKGDKRWVNFPAKQYTTEDGEKHWQNLVTLDEGSAYWLFQDLACEAIDLYLEKEGITILKEEATNELPF